MLVGPEWAASEVVGGLRARWWVGCELVDGLKKQIKGRCAACKGQDPHVTGKRRDPHVSGMGLGRTHI